MFVHTSFHVAESNVRVGAFSGLRDLHSQIFVTDPSANESGVENECLDKSVSGTAKDFIFIRLRNTAGRIRTTVDQDAFAVSVDEQAGEPENSWMRICCSSSESPTSP